MDDDEFALVKALGVLVQEVPDLPVEASYISDLNLVVVQAGLDRCTREYCADYLLSAVAAG